MRELTISGHRIADSEPPFIVAEVGSNHQGSVETAKLLFRAAADCGVQAVKLQKRDNRTLYTPAFYNAPYNSQHAFGPTYGAHREALEFDFEQYTELKAYAESLGLVFFATAFDIPSADFLHRLGVPAFKVASGDLTNTPLLVELARYRVPLIISTGGGTFEDVQRARRAIWPIDGQGADSPSFAFLQCTAAYPCEAHEMNLRVIETYRSACPNIVIGLSDHQSGIAMGPVAFALGARIFEKHFTLNRTWKGSDQAFSLEPVGMRKYVRDLKRVREALGDGVKRVYESERAPIRKMAKSPYAHGTLDEGTMVQPGFLDLRSPADGLPAWKADKFYGCVMGETVLSGDVLDSTGVLEPLLHAPIASNSSVLNAISWLPDPVVSGHPWIEQDSSGERPWWMVPYDKRVEERHYITATLKHSHWWERVWERLTG